MIDEGYIKFKLHWEKQALPEEIDYEDLIINRQLMYEHHLIGWDTELRVGFGNISKRYPQSTNNFLISGTQTGGLEQIESRHFCLVKQYDTASNQLWCQGPIKASSESMTHAAIYSLAKNYQSVIHIHHRRMWEYYYEKVPTTDPAASYGTPEMAQSIITLGEKKFEKSIPLIVMGGHQDGLLAFGPDLGSVAATILAYYQAIM